MKFTKMSLVAALLIGSSAFAIENVKVSGDAKLYYSTTSDSDNNASTRNNDLFDDKGAIGQVALGLGATADLVTGVSGGLHATILSTLGLENNLVNGVWAGNIDTNDGGTNLDASTGTGWWIDNAWIAATAGKTTGKIGRMDLDTPLAFTETWNIAKNTFEAAVLINQDIPDTTLVAAYVGGSNGANGSTVQNAQNGTTPFTGFTTYNDAVSGIAVGGKGAYAVGAVNNSFKPLTVQAWYYDVKDVTDAYWLQADYTSKVLPGLIAGVQYADLDPKKRINIVNNNGNVAGTDYIDGTNLKDSKGYALMLGYELKDVATLKVAYSSMKDDGALTIQNTATGDQSKLYTEAWWNYGVVGAVGSDTYKISASTTQVGVDFDVEYTHSSVDAKGNGEAATMGEFALTASKSFGPLDTTLAYVNTSMDNKNGGNSITGVPSNANGKYDSDMIQAYLTLNF